MSMDFDIGPPTNGASPIADLSYRSYTGPLHTRAVRWWIVALATIRGAFKKPGFWIVFGLAALPYLIDGIVMLLSGIESPFSRAEPGQKFALHFSSDLSSQQILLFVAALIVGSGSIAADNRANALLVYLSKPITKGDYLLGKWMGLFLPLFAIAFAPALLFYIFCLLSYTNNGFLRDEPLLFVRVLLACMVPGAVHASLLLAFSAWSKTPRMAGAIYAAFYFISQIVAGIAWSVVAIHPGGHIDTSPRSQFIQHLSVDGVIKGLAQNIFHLTQHVMTRGRHNRGGFGEMILAPPPLVPLLTLALAMIVIGILATRAKIRAVEVVRG